MPVGRALSFFAKHQHDGEHAHSHRGGDEEVVGAGEAVESFRKKTERIYPCLSAIKGRACVFRAGSHPIRDLLERKLSTKGLGGRGKGKGGRAERRKSDARERKRFSR